jgi:hypothetical protein
MKIKCDLCKNEIQTTFLDKLEGTSIKVGEGETSKKFHICNDCQKEHKNDLKEKVKNL